MRSYTFTTESFPARGGQRRGLSLNGAVKDTNPEGVTEASFFGIADLIDPKNNRREDAQFAVALYHGGGMVEHFDLVASWAFDGEQHYADLSASGAGIVVGTVSESVEPGTPSRKTMEISVLLP